MALPIFVSDEAFGYFGLAMKHDHVPGPQLELIQALANQAGLALLIARLASLDKAASLAREQEIAAQLRAEELTESLRQIEHESDSARVPGILLLQIAQQAEAQTCLLARRRSCP